MKHQVHKHQALYNEFIFWGLAHENHNSFTWEPFASRLYHNFKQTLTILYVDSPILQQCRAVEQRKNLRLFFEYTNLSVGYIAENQRFLANVSVPPEMVWHDGPVELQVKWFESLISKHHSHLFLVSVLVPGDFCFHVSHLWGRGGRGIRW